MEILFVTNKLPYPPVDGWKIRVFSLIQSLARHHRISLISFARTTEEMVALDVLRDHCVDLRLIPRNPRYSPWKLLRGLVGPTPFPVLNYWDSRMADAIKALLNERKFDVVQVETLHMAQYCLDLTQHTVLDLHNVESILMKRYAEQESNPWKRAYAHIASAQLAGYERAVCKRFTCCITCSEEDLNHIHNETAAERIRVIPNGVDLDRFRPDGISAKPKNKLVFVGRMDYHANVDGVRWFCQDIFPRLQKQRPDLVFQIVGSYPSQQVRRLAKPGRVEVLGYVDDVRPLLRDATIVVIPLRIGGGTRLKLLEALAMGKPVVSTKTGAEGIAATSGRDLILVDDAEEFADQVLKLLDNTELKIRLGMWGRRLVEAKYGWESIVRQLDQLYRECTTDKHK